MWLRYQFLIIFRSDDEVKCCEKRNISQESDSLASIMGKPHIHYINLLSKLIKNIYKHHSLT